MLNNRINYLMEVLNADNVDIAQLSGFDQSNVSRMRSGARAPARIGKSINRFLDGVLKFAENTGKTELLCSSVGIPADSEAGELRDLLMDWLYEDTKPAVRLRTQKYDEAGTMFGDKLNNVMKIADFSGAALSKAVNIDPSYLSRMRGGKRLLNNRSKVLERMCGVLIDRIKERLGQAKLAELVGIPADQLISSPLLLADWLLDTHSSVGKNPLSQLISRIELMGFDSEMPVPEMNEDEFSQLLNEDCEWYKGIEGLREAVVRFLYSACCRSGSELLLYSDQSMEWMNGDYHLKWLTLMGGVLRNGVRIKIIHNIERSSAELLEAIASWLPLYMSGLIEPFYCTKRLGERFCRTMFIDKEKACIEGSCVRSFEDSCEYRYITDKDMLALRQEEYEYLLEFSRPLIQIEQGVQEPSEDSIRRKIGNVQICIESSSVVLNKLSEPQYSFRFDHPLLLGSFMNFVI